MRLRKNPPERRSRHFLSRKKKNTIRTNDQHSSFKLRFPFEQSGFVDAPKEGLFKFDESSQDDKKTITEDGNSEQTRKPVLDFLCIFFFLMKRNPPSPPKDGQNERDKNMFQREIFSKLHVLLTLFSRELKVLFVCERTAVMALPVR